MSREHQSTTESPIFILSCERSGSTLLRYIIDTHPSVCSPAHLHLGQLCECLHRTVYYSVGQTASVEDEAARERLVAAEVRRVVDELMGRYARAKGKRVWCEKTTENLQYLKVLTDVFPDARFICLYRNCMDVAHSTAEYVRIGALPELAAYVQKSPKNIVEAMVNNWVDKTSLLLEFELANASRCFRLKYESLVLNTSETLRAMFEALALPWDDNILNAVFSTEHDQGMGDKKLQFTKKSSPDSSGRGSTLSSADIPPELLDKINELLARLDYPTVGPEWDSSPSPYLHAGAGARGAEAVSSVEDVFESYIPRRLKKEAGGSRGMVGSCRFDVTDVGGSWMLTLGESNCVTKAQGGVPDCTVRVSGSDLLDIVNGRRNVFEAIAQGKLRITGNHELVNKVGRLLIVG